MNSASRPMLVSSASSPSATSRVSPLRARCRPCSPIEASSADRPITRSALARGPSWAVEPAGQHRRRERVGGDDQDRRGQADQEQAERPGGRVVGHRRADHPAGQGGAGALEHEPVGHQQGEHVQHQGVAEGQPGRGQVPGGSTPGPGAHHERHRRSGDQHRHPRHRRRMDRGQPERQHDETDGWPEVAPDGRGVGGRVRVDGEGHGGSGQPGPTATAGSPRRRPTVGDGLGSGGRRDRRCSRPESSRSTATGGADGEERGPGGDDQLLSRPDRWICTARAAPGGTLITQTSMPASVNSSARRARAAAAE